MTGDQLLETVKEFFNDQTRPASATLEALEQLQDDIDTMIVALETDMDMEEGDDDED